MKWAITLVIWGVVLLLLALTPEDQLEPTPPQTCFVAGATFPASAEECARIHAAIERRIANEQR